MVEEIPKKPRGFATMTKDKVRELARQGGKAAHAQGKAYEFTTEKAREAGRKGGVASHARRRAREAAEDGEP